MSYFDVIASGIVWYLVLPTASTLCLTFIILSQLDCLRQRLFVFIHQQLSGNVSDALFRTKKNLFKELHTMRSLDWNLRNKGLIRILEVGCGPGVNFQFFPRNARVIVVEPNNHFLKDLTRNGRHVHLEKVICGKGEKMSEVADNSVDAVVITLVLCSVTDVAACIREMHRVLAPGGKVYFLEHCYGVREKWQERLQTIATPLWGIVCGGCHLNRDVANTMSELGIFTNIQTTTVLPADLYKVIQIFIGQFVVGTAQKPPL